MEIKEQLEKAIEITKEIINDNLKGKNKDCFKHVCMAQGELKIALDHINGRFKGLNKNMF